MQDIEALLGKFNKEKRLPTVPRLEIAFWQRAAQKLHVGLRVPRLEQVLIENNGPEGADVVEVGLHFPLGCNMQKLQAEVKRQQGLYD